ncbi:hypothetical protein [Kribbella sp. CA-294648]|uniref:hypothetical protein n=1 Tax=Kribbella sp. CA-294648 TaxID=3239948 RepID=UPI003D91F360
MMKKLWFGIAAGAVIAGLTGCGQSSTPATGPATPPAGSGTPVASATTSAPAPSAVAESPSIQVTPAPISLAVRTGTVAGRQTDIVTINGWTAYRFEKDEDKPPKVNCANDCVLTWPPAVTDSSKLQITGIDPQLVGTVTRADGYQQVTLNGWPLYRFKDDKTATDTLGEGAAGNWSAVRPDGKPVVPKGN